MENKQVMRAGDRKARMNVLEGQLWVLEKLKKDPTLDYLSLLKDKEKEYKNLLFDTVDDGEEVIHGAEGLILATNRVPGVKTKLVIDAAIIQDSQLLELLERYQSFLEWYINEIKNNGKQDDV